MLRRVMALAEFIGLPRAAQRTSVTTPTAADSDSDLSKYLRPTILWKSICSVDRLVGTMFNLPFGTAAYGFPAPDSVMLDGNVLYQEFFSYIAFIASKVQDVDEAYLSRRSETRIIERVYKIEQDLETLADLVPRNWWHLTDLSPLPAHVLQYWFFYFKVRAHVQLALRNGTNSAHAFSSLTCYQASRSVAQRYVKLRALLPSAFFAGRVLDLQALTGAVALLFTSQRQAPQSSVGMHQQEDVTSIQLVEDVITMMESISGSATGIFARQGAPALRALKDLLVNPSKVENDTLMLHVPMLGKIHVHSKSQKAARSGKEPAWDSSQPALFPNSQTSRNTASLLPNSNVDLSTSGFTTQELLPWSMDLMMDDFLPFGDDPLLSDQYLFWDTGNMGSQM